jgi:hypothetical protein
MKEWNEEEMNVAEIDYYQPPPPELLGLGSATLATIPLTAAVREPEAPPRASSWDWPRERRDPRG